MDSLQTQRQLNCARSLDGHAFPNSVNGACAKCGLTVNPPSLEQLLADHSHGSVVEQVHRMFETRDQQLGGAVSTWTLAEECVRFVFTRAENTELNGSNHLSKGIHMVDTDQVRSALPFVKKKRRFTKKRILGTLALVATTAVVTAKIARSDVLTPIDEPETGPESPWTGDNS